MEVTMNIWKIDRRKRGSIPDVQILTSLVHTVSVYPRCAPAVCSHRTGAKRDESGRNSSAFIYSRQCYGPGPVWGTHWSRYVPVMLRFATVKSWCRSGGATVCPGASRYGYAPGIGGRAPVSLRRVTEVGRQSPGVSRQPTNINELFVKLITEMSFAKYRNQFTYLGKRTAMWVAEKIGNGVINETLPFYTRLSVIKTLLKIIKKTWLKP